MAPTRKLASLFYDLNVRTEGLQRDLDQSERAFGKLTSFVLRNPVVAMAAVGTAALSAAAKATQMASVIDTSMRKVASSVQVGTGGMATLRREVESLSKATGKSQAELAQVAEVIARTGAGSATEVASRLKAAVDASQASGTDLQVIVAGLDQTLDLFGLSSADASAALAELFSVSRGKTSLEDLFASLQAAAPGIQKLGLDLPTAARALVQLGESGLSTKQAATELKRLAEGGAAGRQEIEKLAATIPAAANPMQDLATAAKNVNDAAENAGPKLRAELNATLIKLGNEILPGVNMELGVLMRTLERINGGTTEDLQQAFTTIIGLGRSVIPVLASNDWNDASEKIRRVQRAILQLSDSALSGRVELEQFGVQGLGVLANQIRQFSSQSRLFTVGQQKELRAFLDLIIKTQAELVRVQGSRLRTGNAGSGDGAAAGGVASIPIDKEAEQVSDNLEAMVNLGPALARFYDDERKRRMQLNEALISTGRSTVETMRQLLLDLQAEFEKQGFSKAQARILADAKLGIKTAKTDLDAASKGLNELNQKTDESRKKTQKSAEEQARAEELALLRAQNAARAIQDVGRLILTAADAFGVLSDEAAKALASVVDVGIGLGRVFAGDAAGGASQIASGLVGLASQAFGKDPAAAQRQKEHQENLAALKEIAKHTGDLLGVTASGKSIAGVRDAVGLLLANTGAAGGFRKFGDAGPLRNIDEASFLEFRTGQSFKEIEALAKSLGITLNGTKQSYIDFFNALRQLDLEAFSEGFSGQIRKLEIEARLDPTAFEGIEGIIARLKVLAGPDGAPAIAKALEGIDVTTASGRSAAIAKLTETLRNLSSLDVADLGGLSLDQFIEEILESIERLRALDPAAKKAGERLNDAMEAWGVAVELGTMTAEERLQKIKDFVRLNFSGLNDEALAALDFSSLDAMDASIAKIVDAFAADGELSDAEKEQIAMLQAIREAYKSTIPEAQGFTDALDVLNDRFALFGTNAVGQFKALGTALAEQFPSLGTLLDGLDLENDPQALNTLKARAEAIFDALAEGGVTTEEQAIVDAIKQILKAAADAADEIAQEAADRLAAESTRRQAILDRAETRIRLNDVTDPVEQLKIRMRALGEAFPELGDALGQFDLATQEGRDALEAWIRQMVDSPEALKAMAQVMGVTVDALVDTLLGLEDGADSATQAVQSLADKLQTAFDEIDFDLTLNNITEPIERLTRTVKGIAKTIPEIDEALKGIDLTTATGRKAAEAALVALGTSSQDASVRQAVLAILNQIRSIDANGATAADGVGASAGVVRSGVGTSNLASAASITEVTANRWLDAITTDLALSRERNGLLEGILASVASAPRISAPLFSGAGAERGAIVNNYNFEIPVNFNGPVTTADATELAATLQRAIYQFVTQQLAVDLTAAQRLAGRAVA